MAKIYSLKISNFRGIKDFHQVFDSDFVCIIGRGDSGKTSILDAISYVLSPSWNLSFADTDFYGCDLEKTIEIEASIYDLPKNLIREDKYGLYIRGLNREENIIQDEIEDNHVALITIKLCVERDLEPRWYVINTRQVPIEIKARDRASLNIFLVSDYIDKHFSWNQGSPLYSLLRQEEDWESKQEKNILIEALREAKVKIDGSSFNHLVKVTETVIKNAQELGIEIGDTSTTIDFRDFLIKDSKVCLHEGKIPFRLKGKGSKRLISIAIQTELAKIGGIILIDEIEHGLEPDRAQHLAKTLRENNSGQIFVTTHSRDVLVELEAQNLFLMQNGSSELKRLNNDLQGCIRSNPEAFFSTNILICEGATEIGICRALNDYRIHQGKENATFKGIRFVDGHGSELINYSRKFKDVGYDVCLFCDSDVDDINSKKIELLNLGIRIVDCDAKKSIEMQIFNDLPWDGIQELISYHIEDDNISLDAVTQNLRASLPNLAETWQTSESQDVREQLGKISCKKGWFKRIDHGIFLGGICFKYLDKMEGKNLKKQFGQLSEWIENA
jgi:putative ATP-dependent endonuclease of the OLD family